MNIDAVKGVGQTGVPLPVPVPAADQAQRPELIQAVRAVNAAELFGANTELTFAVDRGTRRPVVRLVDRTTRELIRQVPPEYVLRVAAELLGSDR